MLIAEVTGTGMSAITSQLTTGVTAAGLFGTVSESKTNHNNNEWEYFRYSVLRKVVKGASKGKATC